MSKVVALRQPPAEAMLVCQECSGVAFRVITREDDTITRLVCHHCEHEYLTDAAEAVNDVQ